MQRFKLARVETKVLSTGRIHAVVSTEAKDRDGDIIRVAGWQLDNFMRHPVLLSSHNYRELRSQIGEWEDMAVKGKRLEGVAHYLVGEGNEEADWGYNLATKGMAAYSVGFIPDMDKAVELEGTGGFFGNYEFNGQELLEVSQVTIPSNPQALQTLKGLGMHPVMDEMIDEMLLMPAFPMEIRPYENEHACRLRNPDDFKPDSFRRTTRKHDGKEYSVIMGRLKEETTMTEQAYRYGKDVWTAGEARSHCKDHDGSFEAASGKAIILQESMERLINKEILMHIQEVFHARS
uniref:Putative prohead protease n=1 Tax=viral metagenome TaxID=1070528 RepID=A0A6M3XKJ0_9ZZZZ